MNRVFNNNLAKEMDVASHLDQGNSMHNTINICVECKLVFPYILQNFSLVIQGWMGFFPNQNDGNILLDLLIFIGHQHIRIKTESVR